jgi:hypothetical protein
MHLDRRAFLAVAPALAAAPALGLAQQPIRLRDVLAGGRQFLADQFDPAVNLLPEYRGAKVYWLYHDNYLAAKLLDPVRPDLAGAIRAATARERVWGSGKIETLFGEAPFPLPFREPQLRVVRRVGDKEIKTEVITNKVQDGWDKYADLVFMAAIATADARRPNAGRVFDAGMRMWDGKGFADEANKKLKRYSVYKLALAVLAARRAGRPVPAGLTDRILSVRHESGGFVTDYDAAGKPVGLANVETTCLCLLALEAAG